MKDIKFEETENKTVSDPFPNIDYITVKADIREQSKSVVVQGTIEMSTTDTDEDNVKLVMDQAKKQVEQVFIGLYDKVQPIKINKV